MSWVPDRPTTRTWLGNALFLIALLSGVFGAILGSAADKTDERGIAAPGVLEHHGNAQRSGMFVVPSLTWDRARNLHSDAAFHANVAGSIYAQPLYWHPRGSNKALLLVATEQNVVYALDAATGGEVWKTSLGPPAPRSALPCGNIDPLGITGTPVIDEHSQAIYVDALIHDKAQSTTRHRIFALALKDGTVLSGWPIDVEAALKAAGKSFNSSVQNQRGALTVIGKTLYVPYGGHFGDCGDYHGWVIGVALQPPHMMHAWSTRGRGGGVWAPGGIASDGRSIYVVTGNTLRTRTWSDGEAVIRLGLDLSYSGKAQDFFAPADWQALDAADADLGGTHPVLLSLPGATSAEVVMALGKDGKAYVLDRHHLGGIGGAVLVKKVSSDPIRTAPAYFSSDKEVLVAFQGRGAECPAGTRGDLTVIGIAAASPPMLRVAWCAAENGRGSPIVTTTDGKANPIVWAIGAEGDNRLHGFRGDNGAVVFSGGGPAEAMNQVRRFQTPIAAGDRLYVAADQHVYAFGF
ncbi:MAG: hypothetical protein E6H67_04620 [Betaproteobacteria bacterium]|nr:MAG: hypothetical protein E6H74_02955 [Betaproteobacteria bacterium]TMH07079.1 MAG: hypothetical protein E6H67_04620 [Betaproteobacteria bacterium]